MLKQVRHLVAFACFAATLFSSAAVHAASLGKIEVGSQLGEPFYAEVPLNLEAGESVTRLFIEIAAPSDYKIFEVYRDPVLSSIRADVTSDKRGTRVKLSSRTSIKAPFFNLVLKVRYGRVAHFKKFAVFLEPPKSIQTAAQKAPQPTIQAVGQTRAVDSAPVTDMSDADSSSEAETSAATEQSTSFEGWARTNRYGPIVYGDMLSTVAARLRLDKRYKPTQVMAALFEKNKDKFDRENMNMLKTGSFLEVPTAAEVEQRSAKEAYRVFAQHEKQWKELTRKPRYAAVAEAQRTRYSKRVSIGGQAKGSAAAPVSATPLEKGSVAEPSTTANQGKTDAASDAGSTEIKSTLATDSNGASGALETNPMLAELQAKNKALQQQLLANQKSIEAMNAKLDDVATATEAASTARIEKLEVLLVRMQAELEKANNQNAAPQQGPGWIIWLLAALVVILLGTVAVLMRREPVHPADAAKVEDEVESAVDTVVIADEPLATQVQDEVEEQEQQKGQEEDVFDSISSFSDDLTDTDTAEMEPFDTSLLDEDPDPNVDYLSEADVYVRYGMDDEALHQLNLALRLQPDFLEAHIKKAQLLRRTGDMTAFNEAKVDAGTMLESANLDQFNAALHEVVRESEDEPVEQSVSGHQDKKEDSSNVLLAGTATAGVMLVDTDEDEGIDFDLSDIEVSDQQDEVSPEAAMEEMDWLHDDSFETTAEPSVVSETVAESEESVDADDEGVTQMFDNLMGEFADDDEVFNFAAESNELDASVFEQAETAVGHQAEEAETTFGATQHLDVLMGEFSEQADTDSEPVGLDDDLFEKTGNVSSDVIDIEGSHDATQELNNLLSEFAADEEDDSSVVEVTAELEEEIGFDDNHGATQELDQLLSEFSDDDGEDDSNKKG